MNVGDYIKKKNFTAFGNRFPALQIRTIVPTGYGNKYIINSEFHIKLNKIVKITKSEYEDLIRYWNSLVISDNSNINKEFECKREDNGNAKVVIKEDNVKPLLFEYQQKHNKPELQIYKCSQCNQLHMGKNLTL